MKLPFTELRNNKAFLNFFKHELSEFLDRKVDSNGLLATDFTHTVKIKFCEGSKMTFKDAFYVTKVIESTEPADSEYEEDNNLYAVFTEHLGYHLFYADSVKSIKMKKIKRVTYTPTFKK